MTSSGRAGRTRSKHRRLSVTPLRWKVDSASVNQERLSRVQNGGSFTLDGAVCWMSAGAHPGGSGGKRRRTPPSPRAPEKSSSPGGPSSYLCILQ